MLSDEKSRSSDTGKGRALILLRFLAAICLTAMIMHVSGVHSYAAEPKYSVKFGRKNLFVGEKQSIQVKGSRVTYKFRSLDRSVVTVSKNGTVKAVGAGEATVMVTGYWKYKGKVKAKTRFYDVTVRTLKITQHSIVGTGLTASVPFNFSVGSRTVELTSSNTQVALVEGRQIRGQYPGTAQISVRVSGRIRLSWQVSVTAQDLGTESVTRLVNANGIESSVDLASKMKEKTGSSGPFLYVTGSSLAGELADGVYTVTAPGTGTIRVYGAGCTCAFAVRGVQWAAHRGYLDIRPENTIDAFIEAGKAGAAWVETDLRVTKDGVLVCLHNAGITHMTNGTGKVRKLTYAQIRAYAIDNGNGLSETKYPYVPTIEDYLKICRQYHMVAYIHLKSMDEQTEEVQQKAMADLYTLICRYGMQNQTLLATTSADLFRIFCEVNGQTGIPLACMDADSYAAVKDAGISCLYASTHATVFGVHVTSDYSPVVGRLNLSYQGY